MGASGSGKTTLLSILGKRLYNYKGCKIQGE
jgi:ABC-type lipoprotein export system ATPase subunit